MFTIVYPKRNTKGATILEEEILFVSRKIGVKANLDDFSLFLTIASNMITLYPFESNKKKKLAKCSSFNVNSFPQNNDSHQRKKKKKNTPRYQNYFPPFEIGIQVASFYEMYSDFFDKTWPEIRNSGINCGIK